MQTSSEKAGHGYLSQEYAEAFVEVGLPRHLHSSGAWIIQRAIAGTQHSDGIGCYPMLCCSNWAGLERDLPDVGTDLVALSGVVDPLAGVDPMVLASVFPDHLVAYKQHFVVDLKAFRQGALAKDHARKAVRALKRVEVERVSDPAAHLDEWISLYSCLARRHGITGLANFSTYSFARQLQVPGLVLFRALQASEAVAMTLWYVQQGRVYYHLGASSDAGYRVSASFALFWSALNHFAEQGLEMVLLGAGAGVQDSSAGLARFKAGWATETRTGYLAGRIFKPEVYARLATKIPGGDMPSDYFPAYRAHIASL